MVHQVAGNRVLVALGAMALGVVAVVTCIAVAFWGKEFEPGRTARTVPLNASTMADFFKTDSRASKAFVFLAASDSGEDKMGPIKWEEQLQMNVHLDASKTQIFLEEEGFYLIFVQTTFKVPITKTTPLVLKVKFKYLEGEDEVAAVYQTHCAQSANKEDEVDAVLSQPVLLKVTKGDSITVWASPLKLIDYELRPSPSFLTLVKVSDLKEGMGSNAVKGVPAVEGGDGM
ncbi:uncharacterized protein LOC114910679 [Scleropages formosus]|uniref:uncharacterized protein LOC108922579 n=1 Tax=Scleropages formosus TaxID=113540 RepID=UPI000879073C|nr:uncharacterized protein LOC108922579 [Scleropages formosus]XP_029108468.1 uncharacterized protein LOC114910679 [Scleropages formosus]